MHIQMPCPYCKGPALRMAVLSTIALGEYFQCDHCGGIADLLADGMLVKLGSSSQCALNDTTARYAIGRPSLSAG